MRVAELPTPALVVDRAALDHNLAAMGDAWPGTSLRPHVKAFKSTALAARLAAAGHTAFCCATMAEVEGMAAAGLGEDLLLANEVVDARRLRPLVAEGRARVTVAVDSPETVAAAADAGVREVLVDVCVGLPRCGCRPEEAPALAAEARRRGLVVRGVMGYEGHVVGREDRAEREAGTSAAMALLARAHEEVGGDVVSGGGTGTFDCNDVVTELQAGSFTLMDTAYEALGLPFRLALRVEATVISVHPDGWAVADAGLKALSTDHGDPRIDGHKVWFLSDEHTTFSPRSGTPAPRVGQRISIWPSHVDPTVALHAALHVADGDEVVETWPVDLRGW